MSRWMTDSHNGNSFPHMADTTVAAAMMDPSSYLGSPSQFGTAQFPPNGPSHLGHNPHHHNPQSLPLQHQQHQQHQHPHQQQQQQGILNGHMRNPSPSSFSPAAYQTSSVIPSKRPRPREEGMAESPRPNPNLLPTSRSETPPHPNFAQFGHQGQPQPQPPPQQHYPHLQNGSANATPSPVMANHMRSGSVPHRVSSASPHPFSPGAQQQPQFSGQASPVPSEHATPQSNNQFMPGLGPAFNPTFHPSPSPGPHGMPHQMIQQQQHQQQMGQMPMPPQLGQLPPPPPGMYSAGMPQPGMSASMVAAGAGAPGNPVILDQQQQQKLYQMRMQQRQMQAAQMQMMAAQAGPGPGRGIMQQQTPPALASPNGQIPPAASQSPTALPMAPAGKPPPSSRPPQQAAGRTDPQQFMASLVAFMKSKNLQLDQNPVFADRPVPLIALFQLVQSMRGYRNVTANQMWPHVAAQLGFPSSHFPTGPLAMRTIYDRNLLKFDEVITQQRQKAQQSPGMPPGQGQGQAQAQAQQIRSQQQQQPQLSHQRQQQHQPMAQRPMTQGPSGQHQQPLQPLQQSPPQQSPGQQQPQLPPHVPPAPFYPPTKMQTQIPPNLPPAANGFPPPHPAHHGTPAMTAPPATPGHPQQHRDSIASFGGEHMTPAGGGHGSLSSPAIPAPLRRHDGALEPMLDAGPAMDLSQPDTYRPLIESRGSMVGGIMDLEGTFRDVPILLSWKPDAPPMGYLGNIDINALTRSIQSGIRSEIRVALDTLATVSCTQGVFLHLDSCEDLVDALIDCAEEQVDLLVEATAEVSDEIQITPYEEVVRACHVERLDLADVPAFGTVEHELDRAVSRLIGIVTILRNLSFPPPGEADHLQRDDVTVRFSNQAVLADESIVRFLCVVVRYLGTRSMLLRTNANTLDFMKELVTLLSNVARFIELPGREQAACLLHFLLAFAPSPQQTSCDQGLTLTPYDPQLHPHLPDALDSLAKLLARDEPNRTYYKIVFALESPTAYDLLTRTFAMAICAIPDQTRHNSRGPLLPSYIEARKPFLMQGLLLADVVASIAPGFESGLAHAWLSAGTGFAQNLVRFIREVGYQFDNPPPPARPPVGPRGGASHPPRRDNDLFFMVAKALSLLRRLLEKARDPADPAGSIPPGLLPNSEALYGALCVKAAEWSRDGILTQMLSLASLDD